jgi:predicted metalloprotease
VGKVCVNVMVTVRRSALVAAVALCCLLAACGVDVNNTAAPTLTGQGAAPGSTAPGGTSSSTPAVAPVSPVKIKGDDGSFTNQVAGVAVADLQAWWAKEFSAVYGGRYKPVSGGYFAIDNSSDASTIPCAPNHLDEVLNNAYYCPDDDAVVWDQQGLMPHLAKNYGPFTVAVVLAHEWGHAIQVRADVKRRPVTLELQADCFAGAWVRHVVKDGVKGLSVSTAQLDHSLAGILALRDEPGSLASDPNAHGSGFDRVGAFQDGYEGSAKTCAGYTAANPKPFQFLYNDNQDYASQGNMPLESAGVDQPGINTAAFESLDKFWKLEFPKVSGGASWKVMGTARPFTPGDPQTCGNKTISGVGLFLCAADRYIGYDDQQTIPTVYRQGGDFAVATLYATKYGLEVQHQLGLDTSNAVTTTLRSDCYAGAWAGAIIPPDLFDTSDQGLSLSPGDLDEAVRVLLSYRTQADRSRQGPGFARAGAFRQGVLHGASACDSVHG